MRRRVVGLLVLLLAPAAIASAESAAARPPNLLLISSDDHRWDGLGAAGNPTIQTPHLDRLAALGVHYRQATVSVSQCLPIRASLLTGLPVHAHGAYSHHYRAQEASKPDSFSDQPTVPSLLAKAGYRTILIGKWHLDSDPWRVGFEKVGSWITGGGAAYAEAHVAHGRSRELAPAAGFTQEILADEAAEFLRSDAARERPFLLWLAFTAPHAPFEPNPERIRALYRGLSSDDLRPPGFPAGIPSNDWLHYDEAVTHFDEQLGRVLSALEDGGLDESTVVVFLGDNGHMMGERGVGLRGAAGKVVPYEGSVRVPMIVRAPGLQSVRGATDLAVSVLDVPPTLLSLAGLATPPGWPGRDLTSTLSDLRAPGFDEAFSEWADDRSEPFGHLAHRLVRTPSHKLIVWKEEGRGDELYDLVADPHELDNLAGRPEAAAVERDLQERLRRWLVHTVDPALEWPSLAGETVPAYSKDARQVVATPALASRSGRHARASRGELIP